MRQRLLPEPVPVLLPLEQLQRGDAGGSDAIVRILRLQVSRGVLPRVQRVRKTVTNGGVGLVQKQKLQHEIDRLVGICLYVTRTFTFLGVFRLKGGMFYCDRTGRKGEGDCMQAKGLVDFRL